MRPTATFAAGSTLATLVVLGRLVSTPVCAAEPSAQKPADLGLRESVHVDLAQIEVTVWPSEPGSDACLGLTQDDFELSVDGKPRAIYAVDALGSDDETYLVGGKPAAGQATGAGAASRGMTLVLFFDLWHLDLFFQDFDCPMTKKLAFEEARRMVREQFHEGDRLLLVTAAGWPVVHYGWIRKPNDALRALDRLEKNHQVMAPRQEHLHHEGWIRGIESLFLALGRYPGRKDVIYLGDDFRFDDVAMKMYEIAARAQANGVVVNAVDLLSSCRIVPGPNDNSGACPPPPPCNRPRCDEGGLGCTVFKAPIALNPLSRDTGGALFRSDRIDTAVSELRSMRRCRYLVSFRKERQEHRAAPSVTVQLRERHKGLTLLAPSSFETAEKAPSPRDKDEALFLLPRFGRGIAGEVALWPYHPAKRGRWKALVMASVEKTDDEPWPDELTEINAFVLVHKQSRVYGSFTVKIAGANLKAFRDTDKKRLMVFPVDHVPSGDLTAELTVLGNAEDISANVRTLVSIPKPPEPGEARPWFFSDRLVRSGDELLRIPSLDDALSAGESGAILGYGCSPTKGSSATFTGRLTPFDDSAGAPIPMRILWLNGPAPENERCGWLIGAIPSALKPGLWGFEPPDDLEGAEKAPPVEFNVLPASDGKTVPADLRLE